MQSGRPGKHIDGLFAGPRHAPLSFAQALDAYPEAYCDFKKLLTLLLYAKTPDPDQPAEVREALDAGARQELAQIVDHTVRQHTGV